MSASRTDGAATLLDGLGLSAGAEALYRRVLTTPGLTAADLSRRLDLPPDQAAAALRSLSALGLIAADPVAGDPGGDPVEGGSWHATAPDIALEALVRGREAELMRLRGRVEQLMRGYRQGRQAAEPDELVEVVSGRDAIAACWRALQDGASTSLRVLDKGPYVLVATAEEESAVIRRGVAVQVIYEHGAVRDQRQLAAIRRCMDLGEDCRMLPTLPFKLALVDERWALLPVANGTALDSALLVRSCSLLDALRGLFAFSWSQAMRIPRLDAAGAAGADKRRRELLTLLAAGFTDESIARHLGVSPRTVQRMIREFMDSHGARTRFQAGVQAAREELI